MKLIGLVRIAGQLVSPDSNTRRKARYLFAAKIRGIDLHGVTAEELGLDPTGQFSTRTPARTWSKFSKPSTYRRQIPRSTWVAARAGR
jgi:hypothetical protein